MTLPILTKQDLIAELLSQEIPRDIIAERANCEPEYVRAAFSRICKKLGPQAQ
jgi:hypothetical protein